MNIALMSHDNRKDLMVRLQGGRVPLLRIR